MHALNLKYSPYLSLNKVSNDKFEIKLDFHNYRNINFSEITPLSKGLYFNILNPILKNINQERILFVKTKSLNNKTSYQKIYEHISRYKPDFFLDVNKINLSKKVNTKKSMRDKLQKINLFKKIPNFVINISDKDNDFLLNLFANQDKKMQRYSSYNKII